MATTIEELQKKLNTSTYTPKTDEQIQTEAQNRYKGTYEQNRLNVQQNYDTTAQALRNQLATLGTAYERQQEQAKENTAAAISAADRRSIGRGMQRSSYNAATLANLQQQGNETLADIAEDRTAAENAIAEQQTLAAQQLQEQLAKLDSGYASEVQAAIDALKEQEYARQTEADQYVNNLLMQLYEMQENSKANDLALKLQEEQLKAAQRENGSYAAPVTGGAAGGGSSSGSAGGSASSGAAKKAAVQNVQLPQTDADSMALLNTLAGLTSTQSKQASGMPSQPLLSGLLNMVTGGIASKILSGTKSVSPNAGARTATTTKNKKETNTVKKVY